MRLPNHLRLPIGLGSLLGAWIIGCIHEDVVPPTASIGPQNNQHIATSPQTRHPLNSKRPKISNQDDLPIVGNPWKPGRDVTVRDWRYVVIHHTATDTGDVESINESHLKKKDSSGNQWLGIGYHFVIGNGNGMRDGAIEPTFRWKQQLHGAHAGTENKEQNQHGIGVCLVGDFEKTSPSPAQLRAVKQLVRTMKTAYGITSTNVIGHRDIRATECPGKYFPMAEVAGIESDSSFSRASSEPSILRVAGGTGSQHQ